MNLRAMNLNIEPEFSKNVDIFLKTRCRVGTDLSDSDKNLFQAFQTYWVATVSETPHPALLGQFRVELTERGFPSVGHKRPHWYGLALHGLTVLSEKNDQ